MKGRSIVLSISRMHKPNQRWIELSFPVGKRENLNPVSLSRTRIPNHCTRLPLEYMREGGREGRKERERQDGRTGGRGMG